MASGHKGCPPSPTSPVTHNSFDHHVFRSDSIRKGNWGILEEDSEILLGINCPQQLLVS